MLHFSTLSVHGLFWFDGKTPFTGTQYNLYSHSMQSHAVTWFLTLDLIRSRDARTKVGQNSKEKGAVASIMIQNRIKVVQGVSYNATTKAP